MWNEEYNDCLRYIEAYWEKIIHQPPKTPFAQIIKQHLPYFSKNQPKDYDTLPLPRTYIVPNDRKFRHSYYWDTFFMFKGLVGTKQASVMPDMIENFIYLFDNYGLIPNFNSQTSLNRSQPPFFTSMILDTYTSVSHEKLFSHGKAGRGEEWLKRAISYAKKEYDLVWIDSKNLYNHHVNTYGLAKYGDRDVGYAHSAELESGWDFTSRFFNQCNYYLPIDLNSLLFKYESDFAYVAQLLGNTKEQLQWQEAAEKRKNEINEVLWNDTHGFFYDFNWYTGELSDFLSLASFVPLWASVASYEQAQLMVKKLPKFETSHGLTITAKESLPRQLDLTGIQKRFRPAIQEIITPKQWDYPNIWAPLEYLTVVGLLRYGFVDEAKRIMTASVTSHARLFRKYNTFFEKMNAETGEPTVDFHYENQTGFGWTNAAFYRYIQMLSSIDQNTGLYTEKMSTTPPYTLAIPH